MSVRKERTADRLVESRTYADDGRTWEVGQLRNSAKSPERCRGIGQRKHEGRELAKGNSPGRNTLRTHSPESMPRAQSGYVKQLLTAFAHEPLPKSVSITLTLVPRGYEGRIPTFKALSIFQIEQTICSPFRRVKSAR
jgi:hypothetical protein